MCSIRAQKAYRRFLAAAVTLLAAVHSPAALSASPEGLELQVFVENDAFAGSDRYYTNGLKLGFGALQNLWPDKLKAGLKQVYGWFGVDDPGQEHELGFFLGQNMYTPRNIRIVDPQANDRPWAGWLYAGWVLQRLTPGPRPLLDTVELDLGFVGPPSLAEQTQTEWHRLIGAPQPRGWRNQLAGEPAFILGYMRKAKIGTASADIVPHVGGALGTVMTFARAGGIARLGRNLSGFGPDTIEPGGAMLQSTHARVGARPPFEFYLFGGFDARAIAYNVFIDGDVFRAGPSVERRPFVYDIVAGASVRYKALRVSFTRVRRSEEFTTAAGSGGRQIFDSLNVGFEFQEN